MSSVPLRSDEGRRSGRFVGRFAHQLSVATGVPVGFRRDPGRSPADGWQIVWSDGPSVPLMRYHAAALIGSVAGVDVERLEWRREFSVTTIALALIRNVSTGLHPLGTFPDPECLTDSLAAVDYPEREQAGRELAARLVRLAGGVVPDMVRVLELDGLSGLENGQEAVVRTLRPRHPDQRDTSRAG
jgi:hypothetical protein